jgi:hypothetical protein
MKHKIVTAINSCRENLLREGKPTDIKSVYDCAVKSLGMYRDNIHVSTLFENIRCGTFDSGNLLDRSCFDDPELIVGFFDIPYNPDAFLEAMYVKKIPIPDVVTDMVPVSEALPVIMQSCSEGFNNPLSVAVFAENYRGAVIKEHHKAYYLIDKFVLRFKNYTRQAIKSLWSPTAFAEIIDADDKLLTSASAIWVHLHEHFHRTGYLPLPGHLKTKSSRSGAGAEELRVDILSLLALIKLRSKEPELRAAVQYILAERLIRYPLQASPQDNYDARSSVALFRYLSRHGVIATQGGRLYFKGGYDALEHALKSMAVKITAFERQISQLPEPERKSQWSSVLPALAQNNNQWSLQI